MNGTLSAKNWPMTRWREKATRLFGFVMVVSITAGGIAESATRMAGRMNVILIPQDGLLCHEGVPFTGVQTELDGMNRGSETAYEAGRRLRHTEMVEGRKIREEYFAPDGQLIRSLSFHANGRLREDLSLEDRVWRTRTWNSEGRENTPTPKGPPPGAVMPDLGFTWRPDKDRLIVAAVRPSSAAAMGKFGQGDVILRIEGESVSTPKQFDERVVSFEPGQRLKISLQRENAALQLWLVIPARPGKGATTPPVGDPAFAIAKEQEKRAHLMSVTPPEIDYSKLPLLPQPAHPDPTRLPRPKNLLAEASTPARLQHIEQVATAYFQACLVQAYPIYRFRGTYWNDGAIFGEPPREHENPSLTKVIVIRVGRTGVFEVSWSSLGNALARD